MNRFPGGNPDQFETAGANQWGSNQILPWAIAVAMSGLAGAAVIFSLILVRQGRYFSALRRKLVEDSEPVHLLTDEARIFLKEHSESVSSGQKQTRELLSEARSFCEEADHTMREANEKMVAQLKAMIDHFTRFLNDISRQSAGAHEQALETKDLAKQVAELLPEKENEIARLKVGYHLDLLKPLTRAFLDAHDDLRILMSGNRPVSPDDLKALDEKFLAALQAVGIEITPILSFNGDLGNIGQHFWDALDASDPTDDESLHGTASRIHRNGYHSRLADGSTLVVRKAVVVRYRFAGQPDGPATQNVESDHPNQQES